MGERIILNNCTTRKMNEIKEYLHIYAMCFKYDDNVCASAIGTLIIVLS